MIFLFGHVQYQLEGEILYQRLSQKIESQCRSTDQDNIISKPLFDSQSTVNCYQFVNSTFSCPPMDFHNHRRCKISMTLSRSGRSEICRICPQQNPDANSIERSIRFDLTKGEMIAERIDI